MLSWPQQLLFTVSVQTDPRKSLRKCSHSPASVRMLTIPAAGAYFEPLPRINSLGSGACSCAPGAWARWCGVLYSVSDLKLFLPAAVHLSPLALPHQTQIHSSGTGALVVSQLPCNHCFWLSLSSALAFLLRPLVTPLFCSTLCCLRLQQHLRRAHWAGAWPALPASGRTLLQEPPFPWAPWGWPFQSSVRGSWVAADRKDSEIIWLYW